MISASKSRRLFCDLRQERNAQFFSAERLGFQVSKIGTTGPGLKQRFVKLVACGRPRQRYCLCACRDQSRRDQTRQYQPVHPAPGLTARSAVEPRSIQLGMNYDNPGFLHLFRRRWNHPGTFGTALPAGRFRELNYCQILRASRNASWAAPSRLTSSPSRVAVSGVVSP